MLFAPGCCCSRSGKIGFSGDADSSLTFCSPWDVVEHIGSFNAAQLGDCANVYDFDNSTVTNAVGFPGAMWSDLAAYVNAGGRLMLFYELSLWTPTELTNLSNFLSALGSSMSYDASLIYDFYLGGPTPWGNPNSSVPLMSGLPGIAHTGTCLVTGGTPLCYTISHPTLSFISCEAIGDGFLILAADGDLLTGYGSDTNCSFFAAWQENADSGIL